MKLQKHIARITNTDQRAIIAYMQLPTANNYALVVPVDSLPPAIEQACMSILESPEGQGSRDLAPVLGGRLFQDTGRSVFQVLHERGFLTRIPVDNITMYPAPGMPIPLRSLLARMNGATPHTETAAELPTERFNPHATNVEANISGERTGIARNLIAEAVLLEGEARSKREQAYTYAPHLRPVSPPTTTAAPLNPVQLAPSAQEAAEVFTDPLAMTAKEAAEVFVPLSIEQAPIADPVLDAIRDVIAPAFDPTQQG